MCTKTFQTSAQKIAVIFGALPPMFWKSNLGGQGLYQMAPTWSKWAMLDPGLAQMPPFVLCHNLIEKGDPAHRKTLIIVYMWASCYYFSFDLFIFS